MNRGGNHCVGVIFFKVYNVAITVLGPTRLRVSYFVFYAKSTIRMRERERERERETERERQREIERDRERQRQRQRMLLCAASNYLTESLIPWQNGRTGQ